MCSLKINTFPVQMYHSFLQMPRRSHTESNTHSSECLKEHMRRVGIFLAAWLVVAQQPSTLQLLSLFLLPFAPSFINSTARLVSTAKNSYLATLQSHGVGRKTAEATAAETREYQRLYKNSSSRMCNWYQRHVVIIFIIYSPILDHISSCWREDFRSFVEFYDNFSRRPQSLISTRLRAPCGLRAPWRSFNLRDHWIGVVVVGLS